MQRLELRMLQGLVVLSHAVNTQNLNNSNTPPTQLQIVSCHLIPYQPSLPLLVD
jgi:hypothetical protein